MGTSDQANYDVREAILTSIRQNLAASSPFDAEHQARHRPPETKDHSVPQSIQTTTLVEDFRSNLTLVGAESRVVHSIEEAGVEVEAMAARLSPGKIAISDSPLIAELVPQATGFEIVSNASAAELFGCGLGITSAQWAIAETGTIVLESGHEHHRLTSLIPPVHLCIIEATKIRRTLGEILEIVSRDLSRTVTFITGASRTSDIELTLAVGVHGPTELHVIVIDD